MGSERNPSRTGGQSHDQRAKRKDNDPASSGLRIYGDCQQRRIIKGQRQSLLPLPRPRRRKGREPQPCRGPHAALSELREGPDPAPRTEAEEVLLSEVPDGMVERSPGGRKAEGRLYLYLPRVREGVHGLWKRQAQVLLPRLLYCSSVQRR